MNRLAIPWMSRLAALASALLPLTAACATSSSNEARTSANLVSGRTGWWIAEPASSRADRAASHQDERSHRRAWWLRREHSPRGHCRRRVSCRALLRILL
jgi:hypothetical protein